MLKRRLAWLALGLFAAACGTAPSVTLNGKHPAELYKSPKNVALVEAAIQGDEAQIKRLIGEGADVNAVPAAGPTPLMWASHANSLTGMKALLEGGADPNLRMAPLGGFTVMEGVAGGEFPDQLKLLLEFGGDPNLPPADERHDHSLLAIAASEGRLENVKLLIAAGASVNKHGDEFAGRPGWSAMNSAISGGNYDVALYLLEAGYDYALDEVAEEVETRQVDLRHEGDRQKVIQWLIHRGIKYPALRQATKGDGGN